MNELSGKVAVITGAASGIGLALAHQFADDGMAVVLADIEEGPLAAAAAALRERGANALAVRTNVLEDSDVERLAETAFATFGNVHILCNNAGVGGGSSLPAWEAPQQDWDWVFGVNFWGVLRGIRAFVPRMIANGEEGHIVNTASMAGLMTLASSYAVSKHAVVCLTEGLSKDFRARNLSLSASVLCPGPVNTNIIDGSRNRPSEYGASEDLENLPPEAKEGLAMMRRMFAAGLQPEEVARQVRDAVLSDTFYVISAPEGMLMAMRDRFTRITQGENPG